MKLKKIIQTEIEVEVELPLYRKTETGMYWAVIDENTCLHVVPMGVRGPEICYVNISNAWCLDTATDCTEVEFMGEYYLTLNKLSNVFTKEVANV